jgi:hypothetical protein
MRGYLELVSCICVPVRRAYGGKVIPVITLPSSTGEEGWGEERSTDSDNPDAIIGDVFLLFRMIVEVLKFALLSEVMHTTTSLSNGGEGA